MIQSFTDLEAWQIGIELMKEIYQLTSKFPAEEKYSLVSQIRRASTSVLANTAEGFGRTGRADKANKYIIARGECTEVHAFIIMSLELQYCTKEEVTKSLALCTQTGRLLSGLIRRYS